MGASIYWQPLKGEQLPIGPRSRFLEMMREAFGAYPWTLTDGSASQLRSMRMGAEEMSIKAALETLAEACERHGMISVWPEY